MAGIYLTTINIIMGQVQAGTVFLLCLNPLESTMEGEEQIYYYRNYSYNFKVEKIIPKSVHAMSPEFYLYTVCLLDYFEHLHRQCPHDGTHLWHSNQDLKKCLSAERKQLNLLQRLEVVGLLMRLQ